MASIASSRNRLRISGLDGAATVCKVHSVLVLVQMNFAVGYILTKVALTTSLNPIVFVIYRDVVALAVLSPLAYFIERGHRPRVDPTILPRFVLVGATGFYQMSPKGQIAFAIYCYKEQEVLLTNSRSYAAQLLFSYGIRLAPASFISVYSISIPIYVFIISVTFGLEAVHWRRRDGKAKVGGVLSALCGSVLVTFYEGRKILGSSLPGAHAHAVPSLTRRVANGTPTSILLHLKIEEWQLGAILMLLAALAISICITLQAETLRRYPAPISQTTFSYGFGAAMFAVTGFLVIEDHSEWVIQEGSVLFSLLYIGIISTGVNYALYAWALFKAGPVLITSYGALQSFSTIIMAYLFLGESIHLDSILGTLLTINGLFLITWGQVQSRKASGQLVESLPNPDAVAVIKPTLSLEEPLLG